MSTGDEGSDALQRIARAGQEAGMLDVTFEGTDESREDRDELIDLLTRVEARGPVINGVLSILAESFADAILGSDWLAHHDERRKGLR